MSVDDIVKLMQSRHSIGLLAEPAPTQEQLSLAIAMALTAPDHQRLHPWQFIQIQQDQREAFGELLATSMEKDGETDPTILSRVKAQPLRAPMLLVCLMRYKDVAKVPRYEQILSCGAAVQNLLLVLEAQGYASIWRTGPVALSASLKQALGGEPQDEIIGLIYIGTAQKTPPAKPVLAVDDFLNTWNEKTV